MQVQSINSTNFESKNTFLTKSERALTKQDKDYWKSLHYEAKARLSYLKFQKAERTLEKYDNEGPVGLFSLIGILAAMSYRKLQSVIYETDSYSAFPNRFAESDNPNAKVERNYKIKDNYKDLIK